MTREGDFGGEAISHPKPSLQVLERTFAILDLFTAERAEWTTTEIARACDLPVPTAHRILSVLRRRGFVTKDQESKRFRLGPGALDLGERARAFVDLRSVAHPILQRLCRETGETTLLTVPNEGRDSSVCLERVESSQPLRLSVQPGRQLPLHAGASQKVLLAFLPEKDQEQVLAGALERLCRATLVDPDKLRADLRRIRKRGWATSFEETNVGVWGIAVPILDERGDLVGSIGLAGPSARMSKEEVARHVEELRDGAEEVARMSGLRSRQAGGLARPASRR